MAKWTCKINCVLILLIFGVFQAQAEILSEQPKKVVEERTYFGVFGTMCDISDDGDFTGLNYIYPIDSSAPQDMSLIPTITNHFGGGALVGCRLKEYAVEISYWNSQHIAEWTGGATTPVFQSTAKFQSINLDLKRYIFPRSPLQPFVLAGFSFPWLSVKDASSIYPTDPTVEPSTATYTGLGFNLGAGLEYYLNKTFSVHGGPVLRWSSFDQVKGYFRQNEDIKNGSNENWKLRGNGLNFMAGATVNFL